MKKVIFFCLIILIAAVSSCKKDNPVNPPVPPGQDYRKITLSEEGRSCSELWVRITADSVDLPSDIMLRMNNTPLQITLMNTRDTIVYFDSLQSGSSFSFNSVLAEDTTIKSNEITINTLIPTSHNFSYQTWEYGVNFNPSVLYDVAIINENDIWAVGMIYMADTSSLGYTTYNAIHWDGNQWELKRLRYYGNCSAVEFPLLRSLWAFTDNEIILTNGGSIGRYDGDTVKLDCRVNPLLTGAIYKILGLSSSDIYVAGGNGNLVHYLNGGIGVLESGTDLDLVDIFSKEPGSIYAAGIDVSQVKGVVLKGNEAGFSVMINSEIISEDELFDKLYGDLASVWVDENGTVYAGGSLLYSYKNNQWNYVTSLPENYIGGNPGAYYRGALNSIRGNGSNDYIIAGERNTLKHFNGLDWEQIGLPYSPASPITFYKVEQKGNTAAAVGYNGSKAFIILLHR